MFDALAACVYFNATEILVERAKAELASFASSAVYSAIEGSVTREDFSSVCTIKTDNDGKVSFVSADGFVANYISAKIASATYERYLELASRGVEVPIGAFSGLTLLSEVGRTVNMRLISVVSVKCTFNESFTHAGLNQTRQQLYVVVEPTAKIITRFKTETITESIRVLCFDNLIVGNVPENFVGSFGVAEKLSGD